MILHHYAMSPFSEKIRLMFGYAGLPWQSLQSPEMPPRPNIDPLSGGYRRIPIAQAGADIFCDSRLISYEIAKLSGMESLALEHCARDVQAYAAHLETDIFWAAVLSIPMGTTVKQLFRKLGWWKTLRFLADRAGMGRHAKTRAPSPKRAAQLFEQHLAELEQRLQADFLFGDQPCNADFAAYHTLWFKLAVAELPMPTGLPALEAWYQRMTAFGHGQRQEISRAQAFAEARDGTPRPVPESDTGDSLIGRQVRVSPDDYALDGVQGILVGSSARRWIVARQTDGYGVLHVHFPRAGFELLPS